MFDHVKFGVSDYAASKEFFLKALEPLGVAVVSEAPPALTGVKSRLWLTMMTCACRSRARARW